MSMKRNILNGFAGGLLMSFVAISLSFLQLRILLHYLPQTIVGIWLVFTNFGAYVNFLDLGLTQTLGREVSFAIGRPDLTAEERAERLGTLIRSCTRVVLLLAAVVYPLGAFAGWAYLRTMIPAALHRDLRWAWIVYFASASLNLIGEGWFAGLYGMGKIFAEKLLRTGGLVLGFACMVCAVAFGWGIQGLALASVIQTCCTVAAAQSVLRRTTAGVYDRGKIDYRLIYGLSGRGLKYAATVLGGVLILQTDNLVIASTLGPAIIPDYQAVAKIVTTFMSLSMMLVVTTSPFMSQAYAQNDMSLIRRLLQQNQRVSLSILIVLGSCLACFADRAIRLWLGANHFIGFGVVWILLAMMLLEAHHLAMAVATMATGQIVFVVPALSAGVLNIALSIVLARHLGVVGVALGTLLAQIVTNNWYVPFYVLRHLRIPWREHVAGVAAPVLLLLFTTLCAGAGIRMLTRQSSDVTALTAGCLTIFIAGGIVIYTVVLRPTDRAFLLDKLRLFGLAKAG